MTSTVVGVDDLIKKLKSLDNKTSTKVLRSAALKSTTKTVNKMKAVVPIGDRAHRTYKGRLVAPGFLKRSIARRTRARGGRVTVTIGVKNEAFYGVQFLDRGTKHIRGKRWFELVFNKDERYILGQFKAHLKKNISKL